MEEIYNMNNPANEIKAKAQKNKVSYWEQLGRIIDGHSKKTLKAIANAEKYAKKKNKNP
jgi:hypothetical protein